MKVNMSGIRRVGPPYNIPEMTYKLCGIKHAGKPSVCTKANGNPLANLIVPAERMLKPRVF